MGFGTWKTAQLSARLTSLRLGPWGSWTSSPTVVLTRRAKSSLTEVQLATEGLKQAGSVALTLKHCSATRREDYLWKYCQKRR